MKERFPKITVVDAMMGFGKTSAAIRYMKEQGGDSKFLYVTPYLAEVDRICQDCGFCQPLLVPEKGTKRENLVDQIDAGVNIATTHAMFKNLDKDILEILHNKRYTLILDESISIARRINMSKSDRDVLPHLTDVSEYGIVTFKDPNYTGSFKALKLASEVHTLIFQDGYFLEIANIDMFTKFKEVFFLTYMFQDQYLRAYIEYFGIEYETVSVAKDEQGYVFCELSSSQQTRLDFKLKDKINILDDKVLNKIGEGHKALSKAWFSKRAVMHPEMITLKNNLHNYFTNKVIAPSKTRVWTAFKGNESKLVQKNGRYSNNFLQISARATNEYSDKTNLAYLANRFIDPNIRRFFAQRDISIDPQSYALTEMVQWVWRSAIRNGTPINIYVPSRRMRELLSNWIDEVDSKNEMIEKELTK